MRLSPSCKCLTCSVQIPSRRIYLGVPRSSAARMQHAENSSGDFATSASPGQQNTGQRNVTSLSHLTHPGMGGGVFFVGTAPRKVGTMLEYDDPAHDKENIFTSSSVHSRPVQVVRCNLPLIDRHPVKVWYADESRFDLQMWWE
jgi:hypothetical protein